MSFNKSQLPFVSVIVPTYNDSERLDKCLAALGHQDYDENRYEIIVVDNGSADSTANTIRKHSAKQVYYDRIQSSYAARNAGIRQAKGEIYAFTDSDCLPSEKWLESGVRRLRESKNCGLVGGSIRVFYEHEIHPTLVERFDRLTAFHQKENIGKSHFSVTANLFTTRNVMEKVGLFDPNLKSGGDVEWGNRVHRNELKLIYADNVVISHPARRSLHQIFKKNRRVAKGFDPLAGPGKASPLDIALEWMGRVSPPLTVSLRILRAIDAGSITARIAMIMMLFVIKYFRLIIRLEKVITGK